VVAFGITGLIDSNKAASSKVLLGHCSPEFGLECPSTASNTLHDGQAAFERSVSPPRGDVERMFCVWLDSVYRIHFSCFQNRRARHSRQGSSSLALVTRPGTKYPHEADVAELDVAANSCQHICSI